MTKRLFIILTFVLTGLFNSASACSCIGETTVKDAVKSADAVVFGQIISSETIKTYDTLDLGENVPKNSNLYMMVEVRFKVLVLKKHKGKFKADTLTIVTGVGGGDCGYMFEVGKKYVIYAYDTRDNGLHKPKKLPAHTFFTDICTRTTFDTEKENIEIKKVTS
jgi:hypothetical protein